MVRATDAKEVGVGDPAEGNDPLPRPKFNQREQLSRSFKIALSDKGPFRRHPKHYIFKFKCLNGRRGKNDHESTEIIMKRIQAAKSSRPAAKKAPHQNRRSGERGKQAHGRHRAIGGGQPDELGITQGQNGEQGNTVDPRNAPRKQYVEH